MGRVKIRLMGSADNLEAFTRLIQVIASVSAGAVKIACTSSDYPNRGDASQMRRYLDIEIASDLIDRRSSAHTKKLLRLIEQGKI